MNAYRAVAVSSLMLFGLAGCGSSDTSEPKPPASVPVATGSEQSAQARRQLAPVWSPKLEAASQTGVADCMAPSTTECAKAITSIMAVVGELDDAITASGRRYPQTTAQIVKMQAAQKTYVDGGCEGDPTADDDNSPCSAVVAITIGKSTLQMTLGTDDLS